MALTSQCWAGPKSQADRRDDPQGQRSHRHLTGARKISAADRRVRQASKASWLGPALLVSEEAALHIVEQGWSAAAAGRVYGVSASLITMRVQVTGARTRLAPTQGRLARPRKKGELVPGLAR